ncbi:hypothetical protein J2N86_06440 [Legionella lytica]|uniref:Uncharacterized protein n=1 Tax=Legionella lytica TaxID=96232 RepID=A0ABY4YBP5_9GAMM|nr:hypothetical protein [Legionella lytica]USQ14929.1 hypothetical protein J2N86_06440 [Legionella lytica]
MSRYKLTTLILCFFLAFTANASQLEAQELCVKKTVSRCMAQCQKTKTINCATACPEMAHNQCRQAGV